MLLLRPLVVRLLLVMLIEFVRGAPSNAGHSRTCIRDRWGYDITSSSPEVVQLFEEAVLGYARLRGRVVEPLNEALAFDSSFLMAHVYLASICLLSTGATRSDETVIRSYKAAKDLAAHGFGTARELLYLKALESGLMHGNFRVATEHWERILVDHPRDLLAVRACHDAYIILSDPQAMRDSIARVLGRWQLEGPRDVPGLQDEGVVRAMWAFALEEAGDIDRAGEVARAVLAEDPTDVTALHALAHVYEMRSRAKEGMAMFSEFDGQWEQPDDLLRSHLAWHRGLMALQVGDAAQALRLYDAFIMREGKGPATPLGMADASSMLWRLWLQGQDVGARWEELRPFLTPYERLHTTSFNDIHLVMGLAVHSPEAAAESLASMRAFVRDGLPTVPELAGFLNGSTITKATNQEILAMAGLAACDGLLEFARRNDRRAVDLLRSSMGHWLSIGGSHAQRDVLTITLLEGALRDDLDLRLGKQILAHRAAFRDPEDEGGTQLRLEGAIRRLNQVGDAVSS